MWCGGVGCTDQAKGAVESLRGGAQAEGKVLGRRRAHAFGAVWGLTWPCANNRACGLVSCSWSLHRQAAVIDLLGLCKDCMSSARGTNARCTRCTSCHTVHRHTNTPCDGNGVLPR